MDKPAIADDWSSWFTVSLHCQLWIHNHFTHFDLGWRAWPQKFSDLPWPTWAWSLCLRSKQMVVWGLCPVSHCAKPPAVSWGWAFAAVAFREQLPGSTTCRAGITLWRWWTIWFWRLWSRRITGGFGCRTSALIQICSNMDIFRTIRSKSRGEKWALLVCW